MRYQQFYTAFRIWLLALAINTIGGTILMVGFNHVNDVAGIIFFGILFGIPVSLPALILQLLVINYCVVWKVSGAAMFRIVLCSALLLGSLAWVLYVELFGGSYRGEIQFLPLAFFSGVTATAAQYRSFFRLAIYEEQFETI